MASANFINECKNMAYRNRYGRLSFSNPSLELSQSNKIQEFTIDDGCYIDGNIVGSVYSRCLNAQLINALEDNIENKRFNASVGVKYTENDEEVTEYVSLGDYVVEKPKDEQTANFSSFTAYDLLMTHLEDKYTTALNYPSTIGAVYEELCVNLGLVPVTTTFTNSTIAVEGNPFTNNETNRTVLNAIAKVACAFVDIDYDNNKIDLKWLSSSVDYTFQKSDYSTLEGGKTVYGPVNSLIIRNSQIESENVSYSDQESITQNGEHQLVISEDYFLYNETKRNQALTNIWNKVNGLTYVECTLNTLLGKPFLKIGNKIRIYTDENVYIDSYVLQHTFKYNGTFDSVIKAPVLTEQQVQTKQVSIQDKAQRTEIMVDKQNQTIQSVVSSVGEQDSKISTLTQTVDELSSEIQNVAGMVMTRDSMTGQVTFTDTTNASEVIALEVYPISTNISYLYPRASGLYPSDTLYMPDRIIRFYNNTTNENFDYILPDDLLYYDSTHYDKFYMDLNSETCQVIKKCKYNADGTVALLSSETITSYTLPHIELTEGVYSVYVYGYSNGYISTTLMAKNIYTDQFYTKVETDSKIDQKADEITLGVNQTLSNYSTTAQMNSAITLKANEINSSVAETYATKTTTNSLSSRISQTAKSISMSVNNGSTSSGITITTTKEDGTTATTSGTINMNGLVSFTNLSTSGQTDINGDNITTGEIKSQNYVENTSGTKIDLSNGVIDSKNFKLASNGNATFNGSIVGGSITAKAGYSESDPYMNVIDSASTNNKPIETRIWGNGITSMDYSNNADARIKTEVSDGYAELHNSEVNAFAFNNISLAEKKENFELLQNALEIIKSTDIYKFNYKKEQRKKKHIGLVIGDKYNYSKELTNEENNAVDLYSMVGVCLQAIKEQQKEIEELKQKLKESDK